MKCKSLLMSVLSVAMMIFCIGCNSTKSTTGPKQNEGVMAIPNVIVYKTTQDFSDYVPMIMDETKTTIVSYPAVQDIRPEAKPIALVNGYWLDRRGISKNVVFLKYTYETYAKLPQTPSANELMSNILDKNPLVEIWDAGKRNSYQNLEDELNQKIKTSGNNLKKIFKEIK